MLDIVVFMLFAVYGFGCMLGGFLVWAMILTILKKCGKD